MIQGSEFGVWGFGVAGSGFRVRDSGVWVSGLEGKVLSFAEVGNVVSASMLRVQGLGFWVQGFVRRNRPS